MPTYSTSIYGPTDRWAWPCCPTAARIFVGETEGDRTARVFDGSGTEVGLMEPPLSTGGEHVPVYLARHPSTGEVYVTDRPTGAIYIYDANGTLPAGLRPGPELEGWQPLGIAFDAAGNLYVTDVSTKPQQILVFDRRQGHPEARGAGGPQLPERDRRRQGRHGLRHATAATAACS